LQFIHFRDLRLDIATGKRLQTTMERSTIFDGKTHYFYGKIINSYFDLTRGYPLCLELHDGMNHGQFQCCSLWFSEFCFTQNGDRFFDKYINSQWPFQEPNLEVPTIYRPLVRAMQGDIPPKIWLYMVQYPQFRYLKWPLKQGDCEPTKKGIKGINPVGGQGSNLRLPLDIQMLVGS
jgi:hypothetical protein